MANNAQNATGLHRRALLASLAAAAPAAALASVPVLSASAAPLGPSDASPELRDAACALDEAHERLKAAMARFAADDLKMSDWREKNPEPLSKRGRKRWARKWREHQEAIEGESWRAQLDAERDFRAAQMAVAGVRPRDMRELSLKACLSGVYDPVPLAGYLGGAGVIGFSVAFDLVGLMNPVAAS
ncbi:hypothetical protein M2227_003435 [Bradyrhizobium elkanii]|uniref:hypothetical protein n=1 Tax=Bradyrhizobium elkanii TaxID=29448 RepID=UPI0022280C7F|nr:hypothetical protein [Bradyrhizobium elkanii]MCW2110281.1 hypothetical protein [Bradyrhizobium elkanii]MCW2201345.1 hypothetical protein [Bradyrhizobium elkanii]MCW2227001.1 hypothetical protein [Bradyrhizobium elkanii]WLB76448.1 hypothetical protein QIH89_22160 [Bradyrhizobium elkanii]